MTARQHSQEPPPSRDEPGSRGWHSEDDLSVSEQVTITGALYVVTPDEGQLQGATGSGAEAKAH